MPTSYWAVSRTVIPSSYKEYYKGQTLNELKLRDIQRNEYYQRFTGMKRDDPKHYDMVVNVLKTGVDGAVKMILDYVEQKESGSK